VPHVELSLSDDAGRDPDRPGSREPDRPPEGEPVTGPWAGPPPGHLASSVRHWAAVVGDAAEPCLALDADGVIVAASRGCLLLLGTPVVPDPPYGNTHPPGLGAQLDATAPAYASAAPTPPAADEWIGRGLLDVVDLVDLTASGAPLAAWEAERIPPLLVLATGSLARGLMRVRVGELARSVDVVSTPLWDGAGAGTVGSLSFFCRI
jgi:hypothetical protein